MLEGLFELELIPSNSLAKIGIDTSGFQNKKMYILYMYTSNIEQSTLVDYTNLVFYFNPVNLYKNTAYDSNLETAKCICLSNPDIGDLKMLNGKNHIEFYLIQE